MFRIVILLSFLTLISVCTSGQTRVFIDRDKKVYSHAEVNRIRQGDMFLTFTALNETRDSFIIQYYPKAQVASKFQKEAWYCGNNDRKTIEQILASPFYSQVASIKLAAFNKIGESELHYIPKKNNDVDLALAEEVVTLDPSLTTKLIDLLQNFNAGGDVDVSFCDFDPHNAIVFFDNKGKQIGSIDVCFECMELQKSSEMISVGRFCREAFDTLQGFFRSAGIVYGTRWNEFQLDRK